MTTPQQTNQDRFSLNRTGNSVRLTMNSQDGATELELTPQQATDIAQFISSGRTGQQDINCRIMSRPRTSSQQKTQTRA